MPTDFISAYEIWQRVLMGLCFMALIGCGLSALFYKLGPAFDDIYHKWLHLDTFGKWGAVCAVVMMTLYGGSKHAQVGNAGADDGIGLVGIWTDTTNIVVSASVTNVYTLVDVKWTNGTVAASTPVSVRNANTEAWTELTKYDTVVITDLATNIMSFAVHTNVQHYTYWWVGTDKPPIYIEESGITMTQFVASSTSVSITWTCDDPLATVFYVQTREKDADPWTTVGTVTRGDIMQFMASGFWIGKTRQWRIMSSYEK